MTKSIIVGLAVLTLSASAAFAAHHHRHHYRHGMSPAAGEGMAPAVPPAGGMSSGQSQYMKNLHDSGYNPKNDYSEGGIMRDH